MPFRRSGAARIAARALGLLVVCLCFTTALPASAQPASLLERAREAARSDRNDQSARLFALYLRQHPNERRAILREYADQLIYSGNAERALPLLREVLRWSTDEAERSRAQHSYALALLWSDQHRQAARAYDEILASDPANEDALINRARALQWLGRPDSASAALARLPPHLRNADRAQEIRRDLERNARPLTRLIAHSIDQADGLEIHGLRLEQHLPLRSGASQAQAFFEHRRFRQDSAARISSYSPGLLVSHRATDWLQLAGAAGLEIQRGSGVRRTEPVYEGSIALLPSDDLRFDLVTARRTLDNLRSLQLGITTAHYFASADYWPDPMWKLTVRGELTDYSDGNARRWAQAEAERRLWRDPHLFVGARATWFRFDERFDHGYFNPDSFRSFNLTARGWSKIGARSWIDLAASAGPEDSDPGGARLAYWARAKLSHAVTDRLEMSIAAERLDSRGLTGTGFARTSLSVSGALRW